MVDPPLRALLLIAGLSAALVLTGCPPPDSGPETNRRRSRRSSQADVQLPAPDADAIKTTRELASDDVGTQRGKFNRLAEAAWAGEFETARGVLAELSTEVEDESPMSRILSEWRTFIDAEEAATAALTEAREATADLNDLQARITRIQQLFVDSRLRDVSRVCNDPAMLPALEDFLDRERPARVQWTQYENGRTDMAKALALSRLVRESSESEMVPQAREALVALINDAVKEIRDLAEGRRFRRAEDLLRRWESVLQGLDEYLVDIHAVAAEVKEQAELAGGDSGGPTRGNQPTEVIKAREALRDLIAERFATIDDYPELREYVRKALERAKGSPVPLSGMPLVRQYRAVCETMFAAERYAEVDRLLELRIEELRGHADTRDELVTMEEMQLDYRTRVMDGAKNGDIDITCGDWLYWEVLQGYFAGREGKEMREFRLPRGLATLIWPDDNLRDFSFEVEFDVIRATSIRMFAKGDRNGRGGLSVVLQPRRGAAQVTSFAEADNVQVTATVFTGNMQTVTRTGNVGLRGTRIKIELVARRDTATIEVAGKRVLDEKLRDNPNYSDQRGIAGIGISGENARVEIRSVKLRNYEKDDDAAPPDLDSFASREPTDAEQALETQIHAARDRLVVALEAALKEATEAGFTSTIDYFDRELAAFRTIELHTTATDAPVFLANRLIDDGNYLDAKNVVDGTATTDEALLARIAEVMAPIAPSAMDNWRKLADDAVSRDKLELEGDRVTFGTSGMVLPEGPVMYDFSIAGRMRVEDGNAISFLIRQTAQSMRANTFIYVRLPVYRSESARRGEGEFREVEFNRQSGGTLTVPLAETISTRGTLTFRLDVIGPRITLWVGRDKVAEVRRMPGMARPSPIGFLVEPTNEKADVTFTDMEVTPLRVPVDKE